MTSMTRLMASPITQLVVVAASLLAAASMGGGFLAGVVLVPMLVAVPEQAGWLPPSMGCWRRSSAQSWGGPRPT